MRVAFWNPQFLHSKTCQSPFNLMEGAFFLTMTSTGPSQTSLPRCHPNQQNELAIAFKKPEFRSKQAKARFLGSLLSALFWRVIIQPWPVSARNKSIALFSTLKINLFLQLC